MTAKQIQRGQAEAIHRWQYHKIHHKSVCTSPYKHSITSKRFQTPSFVGFDGFCFFVPFVPCFYVLCVSCEHLERTRSRQRISICCWTYAKLRFLHIFCLLLTSLTSLTSLSSLSSLSSGPNEELPCPPGPGSS